MTRIQDLVQAVDDIWIDGPGRGHWADDIQLGAFAEHIGRL